MVVTVKVGLLESAEYSMKPVAAVPKKEEGKFKNRSQRQKTDDLDDQSATRK